MAQQATSQRSSANSERTPLFGKRVNAEFAWRVVLCGSMSFFPEMVRLQATLAEAAVHSVVPESDELWPSSGTVQLQIALKRKASMAHIKKIRDPRTLAILVLNFDKYGIRNYIGANSFAEIAVAIVAKKRVYLANDIPQSYKDELEAWGVVPLLGNIELMKQEYRVRCLQDALQMELF